MKLKFTRLCVFILCLTTSYAYAQTATAPAGNGTPGNPYQVATLDNLYWLSQNSAQWTKSYIQTADINAAGTNTWFSNGSGGYYGFPIIGGSSTSVGNHVGGTFTGTYDGQGYAISNLYINRSPHYVALFGSCTGAVLKNIDLVSPTVIVGSSGGSISNGYSGNAVFLASGSATLDNINIYSGTLTVNSWHNYTGGMLGRIYNVQASNCSANVTMSITTTYGGAGGGFLGYSESSTCGFTNCSSSGTITSGQAWIGGFLGYTYAGNYSFLRCWSSCSVTAPSYAGGFSGAIYAAGGVYTNCYATGAVTGTGAGGFNGYVNSGGSTITNCYSTGVVSGTNSGGFGGTAGTHTYSNCFFDNQTSTKSAAFGSGSNANVSGKSTANMKTSAIFTTGGWDFVNETTNGTNDYWFIVSTNNSGYPAFVSNIRDWTGATSNTWTDAANWKNGILPVSTSIIRILSTAANMPQVSADIVADRFSFNGAALSLDLGNYNLTCNEVLAFSPTQYIRTTGTGVLKLNIPASNFANFPVGNSSYNPVSITNNSGSADDFSVRVLDEVYVNGTGGAIVSQSHVKRTWDINKTNANGGTGINFVFNWNSDETQGSMATPTLFHYSGGWSKQTGTTSSSSNSLSYTAYSGTFSPFAVADGATILPVNWISFDARRNEQHILLDWITGTEINTKDFTIQRSANGNDWSSLGIVAAAGNSNGLSHYSYVDNNPLTGNNFYRLLQKDMDGKQSYSKLVVIRFDLNTEGLLIYPNPVTNSTLTIRLAKAETVVIYNSSGAVALKKQLPAGTHELAVSQLSKGVYRIKAGPNSSSFIIQ